MTPSFIYLFIFNGLQWHHMPSDLNSLLAHIVFGENTMNGKNIVGGQTGPITQSVDAVKALLSFKKVASDPLPKEVSLDGGRLVLVLSNKKDAFYTVTARACSCPAATYNPGKPCKHITAHFKAEPLYDQVNSRAMREQFYASMRATGAV
jgi:hypothetical protein